MARPRMRRSSSPQSPGFAARMAKSVMGGGGSEVVLPLAQRREYFDGVREAPPRVALGRGGHLGLGAAQERIGRELVADGGGQRGHALRALRRFALLAA